MSTEVSPVETHAPVSRRRSLFLPGFALGFLLLTAITCAGSLFAAGLDTGSIADLRGRAAVAWTPPPPLIIAPVQEPSAPAETEQSGDFAFRTGDRPRNITSSLVNVRAVPGYLGKPPQDIVAQAVPGQVVEILDGPQVADGLIWWYVRLSTPSGEAEGWMAEATGSGVQILGN
jgi:hypothetical protein